MQPYGRDCMSKIMLQIGDVLLPDLWRSFSSEMHRAYSYTVGMAFSFGALIYCSLAQETAIKPRHLLTILIDVRTVGCGT